MDETTIKLTEWNKSTHIKNSIQILYKKLEGIFSGREAAEKFRLGRNELHPSMENMIF